MTPVKKQTSILGTIGSLCMMFIWVAVVGFVAGFAYGILTRTFGFTASLFS